MTKLPTLYILTSTGAIQQWSVSTKDNTVETVYGQVNGKLQTTVDIIKSGKNLGKVNETTAVEQAALKAKQLFDKKVKEGYVENIDQAAKGQSDLEGVEPMLAFPIEKKEKHVVYPAVAQPKLDGFRCVAIVTNGKARLFSRTRKEITTLPHIIEQLESLFINITLDGELYNHELKHDFPRLASIIKRDELHPDHTLIQYHVYDVIHPGGYLSRTERMFSDIKNANLANIVVVSQMIVNNKNELNQAFVDYLSENYEGAMYRSIEGEYENKRSANLLKVKEMDDAEFTIVGVEEGSGKLMGKAGAIILETEDGQKFKAKMKGALDTLTDYLINFDNYKGKKLTVQFQGRSPDNIPRFPVGVRIRVEE
jgi:DNA ligase 1